MDGVSSGLAACGAGAGCARPAPAPRKMTINEIHSRKAYRASDGTQTPRGWNLTKSLPSPYVSCVSGVLRTCYIRVNSPRLPPDFRENPHEVEQQDHHDNELEEGLDPAIRNSPSGVRSMCGEHRSGCR